MLKAIVFPEDLLAAAGRPIEAGVFVDGLASLPPDPDDSEPQGPPAHRIVARFTGRAAHAAACTICGGRGGGELSSAYAAERDASASGTRPHT